MPDTILQDIKDRLDIAEVIGGYIQLKKAGVNYKAPCPFHNEKSPSLVVSPAKQIWHCFGCGEGGDVFGFVMKYENLEFRDALKLLADKAGVKLPEYKPQNKEVADEQEQLLKINDFAARFYHEILLKDKRSEQARKYLQKRNLSTQTIEQWNIGFAPDDFHVLEHALVQKKVALQDLVKAGVSAKNERGQIYDRFRGRITFPIFNYVGDVVGFTARVLPAADGAEEKSAKYINSPETAMYSKSKIVFGLNFAKQEIRKLDEVIIVEGQMDCISAHQAGFKNVVASSGTAFTLQQLAQLGRFTKNLKFCFDGDSAGLAATKRAVGQYMGQDFVIKIITLSGGAKDPDELIRKDPKEFSRSVVNAVLFLDFYLQKSFEHYGHTVMEKKQIAKELLPLLAALTDPLEQDHYIKLLAEKLETIPSVLLETLHKMKLRKAGHPAAPQQVLAPKSADEASALEKQVIGGMLLYTEFLSFVQSTVRPEDFTSSQARELANSILSGQNSQDIANNLLAKEAIFMVESQLAEMEGGVPALQRELNKAYALLKLNAVKLAQKELNTKIKQAEAEKNKSALQEFNQQFAELSKLRVEFEKFL